MKLYFVILLFTFITNLFAFPQKDLKSMSDSIKDKLSGVMVSENLDEFKSIF